MLTFPPAMSARFPEPASSPLPKEAKALAAEVETRIAQGSLTEGWVRATGAAGDAFLFLVKGKVHSAGATEADRFSPLDFAGFFALLAQSSAVKVYSAEATLLLCMEVLFRKAPSAQIPVGFLNSEELLYAIRQAGKDAVLAMRDGEARTLIFCREGEPVAIFPAEGETVPEGATVADRIVAYTQAHQGSTLDIYHEIRMPAAHGAGESLSQYAGAAPAAPSPSLVVKLGERIVFRLPLIKETVSIGRDGENDLVLDNLSVSRKHCLAQMRGDRLVFTDLGSENGIVFRNVKTTLAEIAQGEEVSIGKYQLVFAAPNADLRGVPDAPVAQKGKTSLTETVFVNSSAPASVEIDGRTVKIAGVIFNIGKAPEAHIKIDGFLVAPVHARISRDMDGRYHLHHLTGWRKVTVNGVATKDAVLSEGDEICLAGKKMKFHYKAKPSGGATRLGGH